MKTRILAVARQAILILTVFSFAFGNAQKLARKKVQITGTKNAKVLGTDARGNVFDNSEVLNTIEFPNILKYKAGTNITIDESDPNNPVISAKAGGSPQGDFIPYVGANKNIEFSKINIEHIYPIANKTRPNKTLFQPSSIQMSSAWNNEYNIVSPDGIYIRDVTSAVGEPHMRLFRKFLKFWINGERNETNYTINGFEFKNEVKDEYNRKSLKTIKFPELDYSDEDNTILFPIESGTLATKDYVDAAKDFLNLKAVSLGNKNSEDRLISLDKSDNKLKFWNGTEWKTVAFE